MNVTQYRGFIESGVGVRSCGTLIGAGEEFAVMPVLLLLYPNQNPDLLVMIPLAVVFLRTVRLNLPDFV
jgi:uncharacterized protein